TQDVTNESVHDWLESYSHADFNSASDSVEGPLSPSPGLPLPITNVCTSTNLKAQLCSSGLRFLSLTFPLKSQVKFV
ncbi:hypothetical protein ACQP3F_33370, partial [Escherichia coli]